MPTQWIPQSIRNTSGSAAGGVRCGCTEEGSRGTTHTFFGSPGTDKLHKSQSATVDERVVHEVKTVWMARLLS